MAQCPEHPVVTRAKSRNPGLVWHYVAVVLIAVVVSLVILTGVRFFSWYSRQSAEIRYHTEVELPIAYCLAYEQKNSTGKSTTFPPSENIFAARDLSTMAVSANENVVHIEVSNPTASGFGRHRTAQFSSEHFPEAFFMDYFESFSLSDPISSEDMLCFAAFKMSKYYYAKGMKPSSLEFAKAISSHINGASVGLWVNGVKYPGGANLGPANLNVHIKDHGRFVTVDVRSAARSSSAAFDVK